MPGVVGNIWLYICIAIKMESLL
uniref:Uncharacterized protein n=1 Tax=Anguilla anguilla TaxID=7936 RepID=A0A0E9VB78_ANGAN